MSEKLTSNETVLSWHNFGPNIKAALVHRDDARVLRFEKSNSYHDLNTFFAAMKKGRVDQKVNAEGIFNGTEIVVSDPAETFLQFEKRYFEEARLQREIRKKGPEGQSKLDRERGKEISDARKLLEAKMKFATERERIASSATRTEDTVKILGENWPAISLWYDKMLEQVKTELAGHPNAKTVHDLEVIEKNMGFLFGTTYRAGQLDFEDKKISKAIEEAFWADLTKVFNRFKKTS